MFKKITYLALFFVSLTSFALPNPAAVNCLNKGYRYIFTQGMGICLFPDFSFCEQWAYFRGTCKPGQFKASMGSSNIVKIQQNRF